MHLLRTYDFLTITPFSKFRFWVGKNILVQSAAQKWSSLQKMIVLMHWLLWQEMSNFYFSLENDPKGGPLDNFFPFFAGWNPSFLPIFYLFQNVSRLTSIIQTHKLVMFINTDTFWPSSCITSAYLTFRSYLAYCCCCFSCYHY